MTHQSTLMERAELALSRGEVVAVTTDTVYGLVCIATDVTAVQRIYDLKQRPAGVELSLLAAGIEDLESVVLWNQPAASLAAEFWPGALSLILPVGQRRLAIPRSGATLSVRVPDAPRLRDLLRRTGPVASTSANRHGSPPATTSVAVRAAFGDELPLVVELDQPRGSASTIIDCSVTPPRVLRRGPIDSRSLRAHLRG